MTQPLTHSRCELVAQVGRVDRQTMPMRSALPRPTPSSAVNTSNMQLPLVPPLADALGPHAPGHCSGVPQHLRQLCWLVGVWEDGPLSDAGHL